MPMEVIVLPHDPMWAGMFDAESQLVMRALGDNALNAHHIGSTAIKSVVAKPIIDMLIVVADINIVDACNASVRQLGYESMGECGIPHRRYFRKDNDDGKRTHHIHVFSRGSDQIVRHVAFRDFMNAHSEWASLYSTLKSTLVDRYPNSIEQYMEGKDGFIKHIDELAASWHSRSAGELIDERDGCLQPGLLASTKAMQTRGTTPRQPSPLRLTKWIEPRSR